jgi:hypothetical protein
MAAEGFEHSIVEAFDGLEDAYVRGELGQRLAGVEAETPCSDEDEKAIGHAGGDEDGSRDFNYVG